MKSMLINYDKKIVVTNDISKVLETRSRVIDSTW